MTKSVAAIAAQVTAWLPPAATPPSALFDPWTPIVLRGYGIYVGGQHPLTERFMLDVTECRDDPDAPIHPGSTLCWMGEVDDLDEGTVVWAPARVLDVEKVRPNVQRVVTLLDLAFGMEGREMAVPLAELSPALSRALREGPRTMEPEPDSALRARFDVLIGRCRRCGYVPLPVTYGLYAPHFGPYDDGELGPWDYGNALVNAGCVVGHKAPTAACPRCQLA